MALAYREGKALWGGNPLPEGRKNGSVKVRFPDGTYVYLAKEEVQDIAIASQRGMADARAEEKAKRELHYRVFKWADGVRAPNYYAQAEAAPVKTAQPSLAARAEGLRVRAKQIEWELNGREQALRDELRTIRDQLGAIEQLEAAALDPEWA